MKYDIVTIGSATRDIFLESKNFKPKKDKNSPSGESLIFHLGSKNEVDKVHVSTGGGATNAAVSFARQGLKVSCISRVGSDSFANEIFSELSKEGVDCSFIQKDKKPETGYSTIITAINGSRAIFVRRGVSASIKFSQKAKIDTEWFYISSLAGNLSLLEKILNYAKKNNISVAFNPGSKELETGLKKLAPLFNKIDVLVLNEDEASELTKIPFEKEEKIFKFMDEIVDGILVMTKGPKGVSVSDGKHIYSAGISKSPVVERTGAGDAFGAGFVAALLHKKDLSYAIQLATANAGSVIQYFSAKTGLLKKGRWGKHPKVKVSKIKVN